MIKHVMLKIRRINLDNLGMALSTLCVVHCFCMPFVLALLPLLGMELFDDEIFHPILAIFVAIIGCIAFSKGYFQHKNILILSLALIGVLILSFAALNANHHIMTENQERFTTLFASFLIISAHFANWKLIRKKRSICC